MSAPEVRGTPTPEQPVPYRWGRCEAPQTGSAAPASRGRTNTGTPLCGKRGRWYDGARILCGEHKHAGRP